MKLALRSRDVLLGNRLGFLLFPLDPAQMHLAAAAPGPVAARLHFGDRGDGAHHEAACVGNLDDGSRCAGYLLILVLTGRWFRHFDEKLDRRGQRRWGMARRPRTGWRRCDRPRDGRWLHFDRLDHVGARPKMLEQTAVDIRFRMLGIVGEHLEKRIRPYGTQSTAELAL
ncbi:MAG: hypothetical protein P8Y94_01695, partial [Acidobacteriota bacterium]